MLFDRLTQLQIQNIPIPVCTVQPGYIICSIFTYSVFQNNNKCYSLLIVILKYSEIHEYSTYPLRHLYPKNPERTRVFQYSICGEISNVFLTFFNYFLGVNENFGGWGVEMHQRGDTYPTSAELSAIFRATV